jgi:hypothetical protein
MGATLRILAILRISNVHIFFSATSEQNFASFLRFALAMNPLGLLLLAFAALGCVAIILFFVAEGGHVNQIVELALTRPHR